MGIPGFSSKFDIYYIFRPFWIVGFWSIFKAKTRDVAPWAKSSVPKVVEKSPRLFIKGVVCVGMPHEGYVRRKP